MSEDDKKPEVTDEVPTLPTKGEPAPSISDQEPTLKKPQGKVIIQATKVDAGETSPGDAPAAGSRTVQKTLPSTDEKTRPYQKPNLTKPSDEKTVVNPRPAKAAPKAAPKDEGGGGTSWLLIGAVLVAAGVAGTFIVLSMRERGEDASAETGETPRARPTTTSTATATSTATETAAADVSGTPTATPTSSPTTTSTTKPTATGSGTPTTLPTGVPTSVPSGLPSWIPTSLPTTIPTALPTSFPSTFPFPTSTTPTATAKPSATN